MMTKKMKDEIPALNAYFTDRGLNVPERMLVCTLALEAYEKYLTKLMSLKIENK